MEEAEKTPKATIPQLAESKTGKTSGSFHPLCHQMSQLKPPPLLFCCSLFLCKDSCVKMQQRHLAHAREHDGTTSKKRQVQASVPVCVTCPFPSLISSILQGAKGTSTAWRKAVGSPRGCGGQTLQK
jgi:hypothetical protein